MTATVYYFEWEALVEMGIEAAGSYGTPPASGAFIGLSYMRSITININENVQRINTANRAAGLWPQTEVKGPHVATATLDFWLPDDMSATVNETWILKAPLDEFNVAHNATLWTVPNTGTSIYGSNNLQSYSIEIAHNKSGSVTGFRLIGSYVNKMTMTINKVEPIMWSYDIVCQNAKRITAFTNGSATVLASTVPPLNWSGVTVNWKGENDTSADKVDFTNITVVLDNDMVPNYDLTDQTVDRVPSEYILGGNNGRRITGTMGCNMTTQAGTLWDQIILSATTADTDPSNTINLGELKITVNSIITSGKKFEYTLYNVTIGELPKDIDFTKVQELTIPYEAQYYLLTFTTADTTPITLWDDQS